LSTEKKPANFEKQHPNFSLFFDKVAWGAITLISLYASRQLENMNSSINRLNENVAVVINKIQVLDQRSGEFSARLDKQSDRIEQLEKRSGR